MQAPGIHFQHPDQPPCAATLPQTHPLKSRIAALLQALHFMRDWQANPFYRGLKAGHNFRAVNGSTSQAPVMGPQALPMPVFSD
jgi:hypothetical protein